MGERTVTASARTDNAPEFSVLITCYFEENSIDEFHAQLSDALETLGRSYEIIFVNDGSTDRTWEKLQGIIENDPHVYAALDLFRNAGQQAAITAAIERARGQAFILMDSDLQLEPAELPLLVAEYDKGYDVVSGYRKNRRDSLLRVIPSKLANVIMRKASRSNFRDFGCTFKIYNADLVRAFNYGPLHIFSNVDLIARAQRCVEVPVTHHPRRYGKSGWTFQKLWKYNMDNVVKLSQRPFQLIAVCCVAASMLFAVRVALGPLLSFRFLPQVSNGLILNAMAISLLLILAVLSIVGEFSIRCFVNLQRTPGYIVREYLRRDGSGRVIRIRGGGA